MIVLTDIRFRSLLKSKMANNSYISWNEGRNNYDHSFVNVIRQGIDKHTFSTRHIEIRSLCQTLTYEPFKLKWRRFQSSIEGVPRLVQWQFVTRRMQQIYIILIYPSRSTKRNTLIVESHPSSTLTQVTCASFHLLLLVESPTTSFGFPGAAMFLVSATDHSLNLWDNPNTITPDG